MKVKHVFGGCCTIVVCLVFLTSLLSKIAVPVAPEAKDVLEQLNITKSTIIRLDHSFVDKRDFDFEMSDQELIECIGQHCEFKFCEREIVDYAVRTAQNLTPDYLLYQEMTFDNYLLKYHNTTTNAFIQQCQNIAESDLRYYLTVGALAAYYSIQVTEQDVGAWCTDQQVDFKRLDTMSQCNVRFSVLQQMVIGELKRGI